MNFELALLWTALLTVIGFFVYIFYAIVKEHADNKDEPGNKNNKRKVRKLAAIPAGKSAIEKFN